MASVKIGQYLYHVYHFFLSILIFMGFNLGYKQRIQPVFQACYLGTVYLCIFTTTITYVRILLLLAKRFYFFAKRLFVIQK